MADVRNQIERNKSQADFRSVEQSILSKVQDMMDEQPDLQVQFDELKQKIARMEQGLTSKDKRFENEVKQLGFKLDKFDLRIDGL